MTYQYHIRVQNNGVSQLFPHPSKHLCIDAIELVKTGPTTLAKGPGLSGPRGDFEHLKSCICWR